MARKILIVDDDPKMSELISDFCLDLGYEVKTLNHSVGAAALAGEWQADLITLDLEMPDKDGLEVLRELRVNPLTRSIPVLIVSVMAEEAKVAMDTVQGLFRKPVKFQSLLNRISGLLQAEKSELRPI